MRLNLPVLGDQTPKRRRPILTLLGRLVLWALGWRFSGEPIPNLAKVVAIGGPHTSSWDAIVALAAIHAVQIDLKIMGKHTLFRWPMGHFWRYLGVVPVNRQAPTGVVEQAAAEFARRDQLFLGIAPEGTRRKVSRWKTGFHRIACAAEVPILPILLDFGRKEIRVGSLLAPGDDQEADLRILQAFFATARGRNPELAT